MSDSTIKFSIDLDPEVLQQQVASSIVKLGVEEALREGVSSWAMTYWIEQAARTKTMQIVGDILEPVLSPLIEAALKEHMTKEWLDETVQELVEHKLSSH